jgi:hypothetical protein
MKKLIVKIDQCEVAYPVLFAVLGAAGGIAWMLVLCALGGEAA